MQLVIAAACVSAFAWGLVVLGSWGERQRRGGAATRSRSERIIGPTSEDERVFLDAVVQLGKKAERVFAEVDALEAGGAADRMARPAREAGLKARTEAACRAARE